LPHRFDLKLFLHVLTPSRTVVHAKEPLDTNELKVPQYSLNSVINSLKALPVRLLSFERSRLPPLNTARDSEFARLFVFFHDFFFKILRNGDPGIKIVAWRAFNMYHNIAGSEREKVL